MPFLVPDPPSDVRSSGHFVELLDEGKDVAFLVTDPPSGVRSRSARSLAGTSSLLGAWLTIDVVERCGEGTGGFVGAHTQTRRNDSGGASSVDATKRIAVDGRGHVVLVEVGWVAHC